MVSKARNNLSIRWMMVLRRRQLLYKLAWLRKENLRINERIKPSDKKANKPIKWHHKQDHLWQNN